jgi:dihydroorotate dehydrogenase electron transfer subunit
MQAIWNGPATVIQQVQVSPGCWKLTLAVPSREPIAAGQFCHVLTDSRSDPLLRRPFSYWDARDGHDGTTHVDLLYTVVGKGTQILSRKELGESVGYMGPLGIGFSPKPVRTVVFVAGGVGIVPFYIFAKQLAARGHAPRMVLLFGGRSQTMLYGIDDFPRIGVEAYASTEDGSRGKKGLVTALLEEMLPRLARTEIQLYSCGPDRMNAAVVRIARKEKIPCEVSMERHMGCALGACGACVTKVLTDDGSDWRYSRICYEGPTYDSGRLLLE